MEILTLTGENLFCFGKFKIDFGTFGKLTLIEGDNQDSPVSRSNGAGKTSMYEALFWTFFGQTKKGMTGDDVINENAKKGACCWGQATFTQGGVLYRVTRKRKSPPNLILEVSGAFAWKDMTKGSDKETQALLESVIKMSALTFSKMTYFGQEDIKSFSSLGDKELKSVFEQALGIEFIRADHDKVSKHYRKIAADSEAMVREIEGAALEIDRLAEKIRYLEDADAELKRQHEAQVASMQAEIDSLMKEIADTEEAVRKASGGLEKPNERAAIDEQGKLDKLRGNLRLKLKEVNAFRATREACAKTAEKEINECKAKLKDLAKMVGEACGECGKLYKDTDLTDMNANINHKLKEAMAAKDTEKAMARKYEEQYDQLEVLEGKLNTKIDSLKASIAKVEQEYARGLEKIAVLQDGLRKLTDAAATKKGVLDGLRSRKIGYEDEIKDATEESKHWVSKRKELNDELGETNEQKHVAGLLKEILGDAGLKNYIFSAVTPELNRYANEYLQALDSISVEISTVKQLKSGEFRDKFEIKVKNDGGSSKYRGNSGGERRKIDMAISMAFNSVIQAMAEESVNILFLDEPFESLDEDSSEVAVELTSKIAGGSKTFLIAHNHHLKGLVYESITVRKEDGFSAIMGVK